MSNAQRDQNRVTATLVESSAGDNTTIPLYADPTTHRLLVEAYSSGQSPETGYSVRVDEASTTVTYVGTAAIGAAEDDDVWQIKKISVSGNVTSITWADGNDELDNIWNNRAALTYT